MGQTAPDVGAPGAGRAWVRQPSPGKAVHGRARVRAVFWQNSVPEEGLGGTSQHPPFRYPHSRKFCTFPVSSLDSELHGSRYCVQLVRWISLVPSKVFNRLLIHINSVAGRGMSDRQICRHGGRTGAEREKELQRGEERLLARKKDVMRCKNTMK